MDSEGLRAAKEQEAAQAEADLAERRAARARQPVDQAARMIAGAGTVVQCDEGLAELAESIHASEDGPEADHDEVMIRKSPSTKAKPAIQNKQGQAPADIDISNLIAKKPVGQGSTNQQPIAYNVAEILRDDQVFELADLLASDFEMPTTDKDFKLSHE
mgnify:CR=1 FL=1